MRTLPGLLVALLLAAPRISGAQTVVPRAALPRFYVDVNLAGTARSAAQPRTFASLFVTFGEAASVRASYPAPSRANLFPIQDVGGGVMFRRRLGVSVSYTRTEYEDAANLTATIPHPVYLNAASTAVGVTDEALTRQERATSVLVMFAPVRTERVEVRLVGGPSYFAYSADMVRSVLYTQAFGPSSVLNAISIDGFTRARATGHAVGFQVGGDVACFLTRTFGVAGGVRVGRGTVTVNTEPMSELRQEIRVGGALLFLGVRLRFDR